jgi:hypothetical protein
LTASIVGNLITLYRNGVKRADLVDNSYQTGNPGIGFFRRNCGNNANFGYTSITATDSSGTPSESRSMETPGRPPLFWNSPNPFNPATKLWYRVPSPGFVCLKVYDISGRETATLVNEMKTSGNYKVRFDGSALTSGVFSARLSAGGVVQTHKMLLLK